MEKLELKLRNMEIFLIKFKDITTEEMIELLEAIGEMKKKIQIFKERKEVKNVNENIESSDKDNHNTTDDNRDMEEYSKKGKLKVK